jgi:probable HAF family extracellular repeat protein
MKRIVTSVCGLRLAAVSLVAFAGPEFVLASSLTITDLGDLGGGTSSATFINNEGDVTGTSSVSGGGSHAFFYSGITTSTYAAGTMYDIGTFGGTNSSPGGINASGVVVGIADNSLNGNNFVQNAFMYSNGAKTNLGLPLGGTSGTATAVNDTGTIVGQAFTPNNSNYHAYDYATNTDMGTLGGSFSSAQFINDNGQIAGNSNLTGDSSSQAFYSANGSASLVALTLGGTNSTATGMNADGQVIGQSSLNSNANQQAFIYTSGTQSMVDLGSLNGSTGNSSAKAVNDSGEVVGQTDVTVASTVYHQAFMAVEMNPLTNPTWVMTDIGTLDNGLGTSIAIAVNGSGEIVGTSTNTTGGTDPFLYLNGTIIDLNDPTLLAGTGFSKLTTVTGINDSGQIIGQGKTTGGQNEAFILTYTSSQIPSVPEPSTIASMVLGLLICMAGYKWRGHNRAIKTDC